MSRFPRLLFKILSAETPNLSAAAVQAPYHLRNYSTSGSKTEVAESRWAKSYLTQGRLLEDRLKYLRSDGIHKSKGGRADIIAEYYRAYLEAEASVINKNTDAFSTCCDGKVELLLLKIDEEENVEKKDGKKIKGTAVLANYKEAPVMRLFIAHAPMADHLTFCDFDLDAMEEGRLDFVQMTIKIFKTYFDEKKPEEGRLIRTSCVGEYQDILQAICFVSGHPQHIIFDHDSQKREFPIHDLQRMIYDSYKKIFPEEKDFPSSVILVADVKNPARDNNQNNGTSATHIS